MRKYLYIPIAIVSLLMLGSANAVQINSTMAAFLGNYIPGNTVNSSAYTAFQYNSSSFIMMQTGGNYIIINATAPYSIITNYSEAYPILRFFLTSRATIDMAPLNSLNYSISKLVQRSAAPISQCLTYTGLNRSNYLSTNSYQGCYSVGTCYLYLANVTKSPLLEKGIVNFSQNYNIYNSSYNSFKAAMSEINSANYYSYIGNITSYASSIAAVPYALQHNQLFPVPGNFSYPLFANCPFFPTPETIQSAPWYCQMLSYCSSLNFNLSLVSSIRGTVSSIESTALTSQKISAITTNSTKLANSYVEPVIIKQNTGLFNSFINSTSGPYNTTIASAVSINTKILNESLANLTAKLNSTFKAAVSKGINQNVTTANALIHSMIANLGALTRKVSLAYYTVYNSSLSNEGALLKAQLDNPGSAEAASLAVKQKGIDAIFSGQITYAELDNIKSNVTSIKQALASIGTPFSIGAFVKSLDSWFVNPAVASTGGTIPSKIASAPFYAALLSLIIGLALLAIAYMLTYHRLSRKKRLHNARHVKRAWAKLFALLFVVVLIYAYATYVFASQANSSLPTSGFVGIVRSSGSVTILVNQSVYSTSAVTQCIASLRSSLSAMNRSSAVVTESGYLCNVANSSALINEQCINQLLGSGSPVIFIDGMKGNALAYKGLFGNIMYASGTAVQGSSCPLSSIFK